MERGQGTIEYLGLLVALALLLGVLGLAISLDPPHVLWSHLLRSTRRTRTPDERALRNPVLGALIVSAAPSIVLERDDYGDDLSIPVSDACREPGCAAYGKARCVLYVHVVRSPARTVLEYWTYYPRSQTDHLPVPALQGFHQRHIFGDIIILMANPLGDADGAAFAAINYHPNARRPWIAQGTTVHIGHEF